MKKPKYLVRPGDFTIFEIDPTNGCYRVYETKEVKNRPNAHKHFSFENLTTNYDFFSIIEAQLPEYQRKHSYEMDFTIWLHRNDGHGGCKGGTREEYEQYLETIKRFNEKYPNWKEDRKNRLEELKSENE